MFRCPSIALLFRNMSLESIYLKSNVNSLLTPCTALTVDPGLKIGDDAAEMENIPLTPMEQEELQSHHFNPDPLELPDGVALLEESVELHIPDIITQL